MEIICTDFGSRLLCPDLIYLNLLLAIISGNFSWEGWGKSQSNFQSFNTFWFSLIWSIASCGWWIWWRFGFEFVKIVVCIYIHFSCYLLCNFSWEGWNKSQSTTFKDIMHFDSLLYLLLLYVVAAAVWFRVRLWKLNCD